jgi:actin related protein 2/3 complex, subunit 5
LYLIFRSSTRRTTIKEYLQIFPTSASNMSIIQTHTAASLSENWRTINIDALDPESSQNFDITTLHSALPDVSEAECRQLAGQVRQLLRGGDTEGALRGVCESAPLGASDAVKVYPIGRCLGNPLA